MYIVYEYHTKPGYINGDLGGETVMKNATVFKTRKTAKEYIESRLSKYQNVKKNYHKGDEVSRCYGFTGKTWQNENSGETCSECFSFELSKVVPK